MISIHSRAYFFISGILSFILLIITFLGSIYILFDSEKIKTYALKKDKFISISINNISKTTKKVTHKKIIKKKKVKQISKIEPKKVISEPVINEDIGSLFSSVDTKKIVHKKREVKHRSFNKQVLDIVKKDFKILEKSEVDNSISKKLEELKRKNSKVALVNEKASTALDINEFLAKLQAFVYDHFYPPMNTSGSSAVVRIWVGIDSKMSRFIIIAPSNNDYFDDEIKSLENRLGRLKFPKNPKNREIVIDITLIAKN